MAAATSASSKPIIRGYKVGILARGTRRLTLRNNDLSNNWKPRLFSLVEHESLVDWLSFHHNEKDEWLRFGAAIYLQDVKGAELRGNSAIGGMNGLLLVRTDGAMIRDNTLSFNSGLGIGLYRSSDDTIIHNEIDYNVRGYSHKFYSRGQDSADLLLFEQSSRNVVALNSLTHGGDGVFPLGGPDDDGLGDGRRERQPRLREQRQLCDGERRGGHLQPQRDHREPAWAASTACGAATASRRKSWGMISAATGTGVAIEHGQDNVIAKQPLRSRLDGDPAVGGFDRTLRLGLSEASRHEESRLPAQRQ